MNNLNIKFKTKVATENEIFIHLNKCKDYFNPPLDRTVNIRGYSKKIFEKSITFEAWVDNKLIGCVAAYFNDEKKQYSYITNVSTEKGNSGRGIASKLMDMCINYAKQKGFTEIQLNVNKNSNQAIHLYEKFGFLTYFCKNNFLVMKLLINNT